MEMLSAPGLTVLLIDGGGGVVFNSPELPFKPKPTDTIVWFGPKSPKA